MVIVREVQCFWEVDLERLVITEQSSRRGFSGRLRG